MAKDIQSEIENIKSEIVEKAADGNYIYRGEPKCYPKICSTLYRHDYIAIKKLRLFSIKFAQQLEIENVKTYLRSAEEQDVKIASELQHYGGKSNLIDFT